MNILSKIFTKNSFHKFLDFFLNILFPPKCFKCEVSLLDFKNRSICPACLKLISLIEPPFCNICGVPFKLRYNLPNKNSYSCGICRTQTYYFNQTRSLGKYEGILKEALINYKYRGKKEMLKDFMKLYVEAQKNNNYFFSNKLDLILYVPLHKRKLRTRDFDQAYLIAKEISKLSNIPLKVDVLFKKIETAPQAGLKKRLRVKNLRGTFAIRNIASIKDKNILLVDDVFTTGATVNECSKVLKRGGANRIEVFTLARAI